MDMRIATPELLLSNLSEFLAAQMGLHFPRNRWGDLARGIAAAASEFGMADVESCMNWLVSTPLTRNQIEVLASHLTVGETYFFRESRSFEVLEAHILPELLRLRAEIGSRAPQRRRERDPREIDLQPRRTACRAAPRAAAARRGLRGQPMAKILVVDDDARNLRLAVTVLDQAGYEVLSAEGGAEGVEAALAHAPDLVLMDVQMSGMDGITALKRLRSEPRTATLKVVALTALTMKGDCERLLAEGFDGYLEKPIRYQEFLASVAALLEGEQLAEY